MNRAPHATRRHLRHRGVFPTALAGLLALLASPAVAADNLVLTARGELKDPAAPVSASLPAAHPAMHPAMHPAPPDPRVVPVSTVPPAPRPALASVMPDAAAAQEGDGMVGDAAQPALAEVPYRYQARGLRDPFTLPAEVRAPTAGAENVPPLERHAISDFRLVAVVKGARGSYAMVTTTEGKGYTLRVGTRIGPDGGRVRQISKNSVIVEVVRADEFGELKKSETILALRPEEVVP